MIDVVCVQAREKERLFVSRRVMIHQLQDLLAEAIEYGIVSPAVLASHVRRERGWKGEITEYYVVAKGTSCCKRVCSS